MRGCVLRMTDFERGYKQGYDHGYLKAMADMQKEADEPADASLDIGDDERKVVVADPELAEQVGVEVGTELRELIGFNGDVVGYVLVDERTR